MSETLQVNFGFIIGMRASIVFVVPYPLVLALITHRRLNAGWRYAGYGAIVFFVPNSHTRACYPVDCELQSHRNSSSPRL